MATARDVILIGVVLFTLAMTFFISKFAITKITDDMLVNPYINKTGQAVGVLQSTQQATDRADYIIMGVFIGLILSMIVSSWLVGGHPVFIFFYILFIIFGVITGAFLANAWEDFSQNAIFEGTVNKFPMTNHILLNLPVYLSITGFIGLIVLFAKPREDAGGLM